MTASLGTLLIALLLTDVPTEFPHTETFGPEAAERWNTFAGTWDFTDGAARQSDSDYDCGAILPVQPEGPYVVAVRFTPEGHFNGGGMFFALPHPDRKNGGMMVRCDPGGRILWGWFNEDAGFEYHGDVQVPDVGSVAQELAVAVDPGKLAFNILFNGEKVAKNIKTFHTTGYVGMQTSGGPHTFSRFAVRPATADEIAGIEPPGPYSRIIDVVGNSHYIIALRRDPKFLVRYDDRGDEMDRAYLPDLAGFAGVDLRPIALTWDTLNSWLITPGVYLLAENGQAIYHFNKSLRQVGSGPLVRNSTMRGTGIAVGPAGRIFVADAAIPGIRVFDRDGNELCTYGRQGDVAIYAEPDAAKAGHFKAPRGIAVNADGQIVVTDRENYTYTVYRFDPINNSFEWTLTGPWLPYPACIRFNREGDLILAGTYEFYRSYGGLRIMDLDGRGKKIFIGHAVGDMSDKIRACQGPDEKYYIADPDKDRILIVPDDFVERMPEFAWTDDGGVKMTMTTVAGRTITTTSHARTPDHERIRIEQEQPICESWPTLAPEDLTAYTLPPKPPAGERYVIDMPVLVAVFTEMVDEKGKRVTIDAAGIAERLRRELKGDRTFYWLNSHGVLNKQFEIMVIDDIVPENVGAWVTPSEGRRLVNEARAARSMPPIDATHSLVVIHPRAGFSPTGTDDIGYVGGGGLTNPCYSGYTLWNHGQGWLMGHEWGHQLDAYFDMSDVHDWWLNHPDGTVHFGRYGEHWDCNAFLCRRVDPMNWLRLRYGNLRSVADADGDGLADADPTLPLDEQRFGSSSQKVDTDDDGLDDLAEMMAGTFTSANPADADTDDDGIPDGQDAYPQFAVGTVLPPAELDDQGHLIVTQAAAIGTVQRNWVAATVFGGYDADHVYLTIAFRNPARHVHATIDFDNDGWFIGRDNVYASVDLNWDGEDAATVGRARHCTATTTSTTVGAALQMKIRRPDRRAALAAGSSLGLTVRFQDGGGTVAFLIDPWQILGLELK